jgi:hypothetical protein
VWLAIIVLGYCSSLNVFDDGAELLISIFWTLSIIIVFFLKPPRFEGWLFPHPQVKPALLDLFDHHRKRLAQSNGSNSVGFT